MQNITRFYFLRAAYDEGVTYRREAAKAWSPALIALSSPNIYSPSLETTKWFLKRLKFKPQMTFDSWLTDVSLSNERSENVFTVLWDTSSDSKSVPAHPESGNEMTQLAPTAATWTALRHTNYCSET